jgi:hypothetical protein
MYSEEYISVYGSNSILRALKITELSTVAIPFMCSEYYRSVNSSNSILRALKITEVSTVAILSYVLWRLQKCLQQQFYPKCTEDYRSVYSSNSILSVLKITEVSTVAILKHESTLDACLMARFIFEKCWIYVDAWTQMYQSVEENCSGDITMYTWSKIRTLNENVAVKNWPAKSTPSSFKADINHRKKKKNLQLRREKQRGNLICFFIRIHLTSLILTRSTRVR